MAAGSVAGCGCRFNTDGVLSQFEGYEALAEFD